MNEDWRMKSEGIIAFGRKLMKNLYITHSH